MNDEIRKLLTEKVLGECWLDRPKDHVDSCMCFDCLDYRQCNRTFRTPQDAQDIKDALVRAGKWDAFSYFAVLQWNDGSDDMYNPKAVRQEFTDWLYSYTRDEKGNRTGYRLCELAGEFMEVGK